MRSSLRLITQGASRCYRFVNFPGRVSDSDRSSLQKFDPAMTTTCLRFGNLLQLQTRTQMEEQENHTTAIEAEPNFRPNLSHGTRLLYRDLWVELKRRRRSEERRVGKEWRDRV